MSDSAASNSALGGEISGSHQRVIEGTLITGSSGMSYRPLLELGEGGMARIMLALATGPGGFNKLVVLKVLRTDQDSTEIRRMLLAEARLSARLNHPNVVQVQEVVQTAEAPYLVMEYLDGRPLSGVRASETLSLSMLTTVISEVLVGLHHAHELSDFDGTPLQIVHRDVSPHNVFVTYDGVVKVLDFGVAKMQNGASDTEVGEVKGKIAYMPPEQLLGEAVDRRADIFAVGAMLWEVAAGARMWANVSQANLMHRLATGDIPRPSSIRPVDPELEGIIVRATAAEPSERYDTALAMQQALDAYLERTGQRAPLREIGAALSELHKRDRQQRARAIKEALQHNSVPPAANPQLDVITASELRVEPKPRRGAVPLIAIPVLVVAALASGLYLRASRALAPAASAAVPIASTISLSVHAVPPLARVRIDSREYAQPNVALTLPRDAQPHQIEVFAEGFVSDTRSVTFDRSLSVEVALQPIAPANPPTAAESSPAPQGKAAPGSKATARRQVAASPSPSAVAPASADCNPPYYFDHGIKTYKPQCL